MEFRVVTISNRVPQEWYYLYHQLFKSVGNVEILVLGQGEGEYTGLSDKPRILYNAIKNGLIKEEIIVFVDAWDVVFASSVESVVNRFKDFNTEIIFGAEKNCFPSCFKREYDRLGSSSSYKYLNSGVIIGYTGAMMITLEAMDAPNLPVDYYDGRTGRNYHFNDQANYMDMFLRKPVNMKLDYGCAIAQNMQDVEEGDLDFSGDRIRNTETNTYPMIIHFNGGSKDKWGREPILNFLKL
jgi:hypothetical protein